MGLSVSGYGPKMGVLSESHIPKWAMHMLPSWNQWAIPHGAPFFSPFVSQMAQHTKVDWVSGAKTNKQKNMFLTNGDKSVCFLYFWTRAVPKEHSWHWSFNIKHGAEVSNHANRKSDLHPVRWCFHELLIKPSTIQIKYIQQFSNGQKANFFATPLWKSWIYVFVFIF